MSSAEQTSENHVYAAVVEFEEHEQPMLIGLAKTPKGAATLHVRLGVEVDALTQEEAAKLLKDMDQSKDLEDTIQGVLAYITEKANYAPSIVPIPIAE